MNKDLENHQTEGELHVSMSGSGIVAIIVVKSAKGTEVLIQGPQSKPGTTVSLSRTCVKPQVPWCTPSSELHKVKGWWEVLRSARGAIGALLH